MDEVDEVLHEAEVHREDVVETEAAAASAVVVALEVDEVAAADSAGAVDVVRPEAVEEGTRCCDTCKSACTGRWRFWSLANGCGKDGSSTA